MPYPDKTIRVTWHALNQFRDRHAIKVTEDDLLRALEPIENGEIPYLQKGRNQCRLFPLVIWGRAVVVIYDTEKHACLTVLPKDNPTYGYPEFTKFVQECKQKGLISATYDHRRTDGFTSADMFRRPGDDESKEPGLQRSSGGPFYKLQVLRIHRGAGDQGIVDQSP